MLTLIIVLLLICLVFYYWKKSSKPDYPDLTFELKEFKSINHTLASFLQNEIGAKDLKEIRTKLNGRTLTEILEQNEELQSSLSSLAKELQDYELEIDTLTRTKKELEADLLSQANSYKSLLKEKEGIIKRLEQEVQELKGKQ